MTPLYVETSAVLTWLFGEPEAETVVRLIDQAELVVSSTLTVVEVERAFCRAGPVYAIDEATTSDLLGRTAQQFRSWELLDLTPEIRQRAGRALPVEPVRTLDALHLAAILAFVEIYGGLTVLSLDKRIIANLVPLGLTLAPLEA